MHKNGLWIFFFGWLILFELQSNSSEMERGYLKMSCEIVIKNHFFKAKEISPSTKW